MPIPQPSPATVYDRTQFVADVRAWNDHRKSENRSMHAVRWDPDDVAPTATLWDKGIIVVAGQLTSTRQVMELLTATADGTL